MINQKMINHNTVLEEGLEKLELSQAGIPKLLEQYIKEIELFNPAYGLVKVGDRRELIIKHILDSLAPIHILRDLLQDRPAIWKIADVGSGAGLPGIPLAICMPNAEFTLIERMERRAGFLRDAIAVMGLPNVRVEEAEMEKFPFSGDERFDLAVFRAFTRLEPAILKGLFRLLSKDGILAAYKGKRQTIEEEMALIDDEIKKAKGKAFPPDIEWKIIPLEVPFLDEERHLTIIRPTSQARRM